jgi:prolyl oligopeptidase
MLKKHFIYYFFVISSCYVNAQNNVFVYPATKKVIQSDTFFGTIVSDPYRWLENQETDDTKQWVKEQNIYTKDYLSKIQNSFSLREQIRRNTEYEAFAPAKKGDYYFALMTSFGGTGLSIFFKKNLHTDYWEELFVSKDLQVEKNQRISITQYEVSTDSKYIAYAFSKNGSDWQELKVADLEKQKNLEDHLYDLKVTDITWHRNGFYYTKYDRKSSSEQYKQLATDGKLYYHKLGTTQDKDSLIFKKSIETSNSFIPVVSDDERFLIINDHDPIRNTNAYYYFDKDDKTQKGLLPLFKKSFNSYTLIGAEKDNLIFKTKMNQVNKVIVVNPKNPTKVLEKITSSESLIVRDYFYYNKFFYELCYHNQQDYIVVVDSNGVVVKKVEIPLGASCEFKGVDKKTNQLLLCYESYLHPEIYAGMDLSSYKFELLESVKISYEMKNFEISLRRRSC